MPITNDPLKIDDQFEDFYTFRMNASGDIESEQNISSDSFDDNQYLNSDSSSFYQTYLTREGICVYRKYSWCSLLCFDYFACL